VRFQIPAPEAANFAGGMALSPDGRKLAFIARGGAQGHTMMWLRALDSLGAHSMPGTEGASFFAFWSPDGRAVGFWAQGKLKQVELSGGSPRTLCEIPGLVAGASWSREGVVVFGSSSDGLFRVPEAGGVPTRLTTIDSSHGELGHMLPWFLPDGRHFLFITRSAKPADNGIYLATLDGGPRKHLMASAQTFVFAPPMTGSQSGHLLFLRQGTLMAQALDMRRFELVGEPFPVAEHVGPSSDPGLSAGATSVYAVSATGVLAYRPVATTSSQLVWFDRTGKPLEPPVSLAFVINNLALSPDGKRVALEAVDHAGHRDIWILDLVRGVPTRLTFDPAQALRTVWSPDGRQLAFASGRGGNSLYDIYEKNSSGSANEQLLTKSGMPDDWSADGRNIVYELRDPKTKADLWVLPVTGAPAERKPMPYLQTAADERQGRFSPDGRWLAYISDESMASQYQVYVQSFPAGAGKFQVSTGAGGVQPRWRRDGKELFYIAADGKLMAVQVKTAPEFEAGVPQPLFDPRIVSGAHPAWARYAVTADGKRFLVDTVESTQEGVTSEPITVVLNWQAALKR
jgi:Tol biopolymer transport system component